MRHHAVQRRFRSRKAAQVIVHRPGLEQRRLTPENAEELLFDDVIWVRKAKVEHAAFVQVLKERGVEVFDAEDLLLETLEVPEGKALDPRPGARGAQVGQYLARSGREWADGASARDVSNFLIGGMTKDELEGGAGLFYGSSGPMDMMLPPLPNFLFQRDPSSWIYGGVTLNPMTKPARRPETAIMEAIYRFHPMFAADGGVKVWFGGVEQAWGRCTIEGGDVETIGNGAVMIGMGERTSPQSVGILARNLFAHGAARLVLAVKLPPSRSYMHLDTVMTMVDRDAVTLYPTVVNDDVQIWALRPGDDGELPVVERFEGNVVDALEHALELDSMRVIPDRRRQLRDGTRAVGRRQQRRLHRAGRGHRLRAQRGHQHAPAQGGHRGDHDRRLRARARARRLALHDLPDRTRGGLLAMYNLRNRSFLKEIDFSRDELLHLLALSQALKTAKYAGNEVQRLIGQGDRADLREELDPHALRVRGRRLRPGGTRHLPRPDRLADGPQGVDRRHRRACSAACSTRSSTAAPARRTSRSSPGTPASPSTTGSPTSGTRRRCSPTS